MSQICQHFNVWCERSVGVCNVELCSLPQAGEPFGDDVQFVHLASMSMLVKERHFSNDIVSKQKRWIAKELHPDQKVSVIDPLGYVSASEWTWNFKWILAQSLGSRVVPKTKFQVCLRMRDKREGREEWQNAGVGAVLSRPRSMRGCPLVSRVWRGLTWWQQEHLSQAVLMCLTFLQAGSFI